jgi:two-component sensor histidine kinase
VHHRIKNNISTISSLLSLQAQSSDSPEVQSALKDTISRVRSIGVLYESLLVKEEYVQLPVRNYVESLVSAIIALYPEHANIAIEKNISDFPLIAKKLFPLGIIINELLTNIMKYAFTGRQNGKVVIALGKVNNKITLTVSDDGNGMPVGFDMENHAGFGLMLVRMLTAQMKGTFLIRGDNGTSVSMKFNI